jgi:hypothetical protein
MDGREDRGAVLRLESGRVHVDGAVHERSEPEVNWAMTNTDGSAARRRSFIDLSSSSALLSSAALRRTYDLELDEIERNALQLMYTELLRTAENLRSGKVSTASTPERTYAFSQLATRFAPSDPGNVEQPKAKDLADALDSVASKIDVVAKWDAPDKNVAVFVAEVFERLSRVLLEEVAQSGETSGRRSRNAI